MMELLSLYVVSCKITEPLGVIKRGLTVIKNFIIQTTSGLVHCLKNSVNVFIKDSEWYISHANNSSTPNVYDVETFTF